MVVRDDIGTPPRGDDGDLHELGKTGQLGRGPGAEYAGTGEDDRAAGAREEFDDRTDLLVAGPSDGRPRGLDLGVVGRRLVEQILGERQQDGPRPATECLAN